MKLLYDILNMAIGFTLSLNGFNLTDFSEKALFKSYSTFASFQHTVAILYNERTLHDDDPLPFL